MISMSGGWFFVVQAEAISVGKTTVLLPGVGSYVALAIERKTSRPWAGPVFTMLSGDPDLRPAIVPAPDRLG